METTYNIFSVHAYKGGELSTDINISSTDVCYTIMEQFLWKFDVDLEDPKGRIQKIIKENISTYASDDTHTNEIYQNENGKLRKVEYDYFLDELIILLKKEKNSETI